MDCCKKLKISKGASFTRKNQYSNEIRRIKMSDTLNASEAVFGFAGWLTCRKEKVVFSSGDDAAVVADLVQQFCDANGLPPVSEHWPQHLIHPEGEIAVPGVGHNRSDGDIFVDHIKSHLRPGQQVVCKVCNKSVGQIVEMERKPQNYCCHLEATYKKE